MDEKQYVEAISFGTIKALLEEVKEPFFAWIKGQSLNILPLNFNVALSIEYQKNSFSNNYYLQLLQELRKLINQHGLSGYIKLNEVSQRFVDKKEAENFRENKSLDLIIWGSFSIDGLKIDNKNISKLDLNFTFGHPDNNLKQVGELILKDIVSRFYVYNYWKINEEDSLKDIELISSNAFDISVYIIALTLKLWGRLSDSIILFEELYKLFEQKNLILKNQIVPHLINCYEQFALFLILEKKELEKAALICEKILSLDETNYFALLNLARSKYEMGLINESYSLVEKLLKFHSRRSAVELDMGFHKILQKNYKNSFKHYQRLIELGKDQIDFNPIDVVEFLEKEHLRLKDPAILYAMGLISYHYGDKVIANEYFKTFLETFSENLCKEMYRDAKKLIFN